MINLTCSALNGRACEVCHFANECKQKKNEPKKNEVAKFVKEEEKDDNVLLVVTLSSNESNSNSWFLDMGYSNHINGRGKIVC